MVKRDSTLQLGLQCTAFTLMFLNDTKPTYLTVASRHVSGFLSVGLSSVKRAKGSYLIPTLQSLFSQSSPEERSSMVVVVLLADFDVSWRVSTVAEIKTAFALELEQGQLVVLHVPQEMYPPYTGIVHVCSYQWTPSFIIIIHFI